ncbi:hypothetical protein ACFXPI_11050 [Streptomyces sp. NPDC059104]|uniref:hypothetical protein n=1 Tax=Streptomyces sp. NPDC059104 TaxID=3346729 RepID=UPI00368186B9
MTTPRTPLPLRNLAHELPPGTLPFDVALQLAREALAKHENADTREQTAMYFAASDLQYALRTLVNACDA